MKSQFLRWLVGWGHIIDGIVCLVTLGFFRTHYTLTLATIYSKYKNR